MPENFRTIQWFQPFFGMKVVVVEDPTMDPNTIKLVYRRPLTATEEKKLLNDLVAEMNRPTSAPGPVEAGEAPVGAGSAPGLGAIPTSQGTALPFCDGCLCVPAIHCGGEENCVCACRKPQSERGVS